MSDLDANELAADWLGPERPANNLSRYTNTLRNRGWLIIVTVILALIAAGAYVKVTSPVYKAQSSLLVSPIPSGSTIPSNIPGLIYASADPTRDVLTASTLAHTVAVARLVKAQLKLSESPQSILGHVSVVPLSNTNVLTVTASWGSPAGAQRLANAFAVDALAARTARFRAAVNQQIAGLQSSGAAGGAATSSSGTTITVPKEIAQLRGLAAGPLPDMSVSALADEPTSRSSPRTALSLGAAIIVGLVLGILGVVALEEFDTRLRREDQLKRILRLPILARIPREGRSRRFLRRSHGPRVPEAMSFAALESFRVLRAMLLASRDPGAPPFRTILVASAASGEGKTTTALNLAASLATSGADVILIEGDLRLPSIGKAIGRSSTYDVGSVITGQASLEDALVTSKRLPGVRFLLAEGARREGRFSNDALFLPAATHMLADAERLADYVVIDSPPLLGVIDALELARAADVVLVVAQLGRTDIRQLHALGSMLAEAHIEPAGVSLIGAELPGGHTIYQYGYGAPRGGRKAGLRPGLVVEGEENGVGPVPVSARRDPAPRRDDSV